MKFTKINTLTGLAFLCVLISACRHEPELMPGTAEICFDKEVSPLIQSHCGMSGCHDGNAEFALLSYDDILKEVTPGKPRASELHKVIAANHNSPDIMPPKPYSPLTSAQIDIISLWILQGAKHTTCPENECDSLNVTFSETINPIFDTYCTGCHGGDNPDGGFVLTDYASIKAAIEAGRLVGAINHQIGFLEMPQDGDKLSDCKLGQINKWINDDMPNN